MASSFVLTGVHAAARTGNIEKIERYLQRNGDPDKADEEGYTCLMWAAWGGHVQIIELLLNSGADPDLTNVSGSTALHWSCLGGHSAATNVLLQANVLLNVPDNQDGTALHYIAKKGHHSLAELIIQAGALVDSRSLRGTTPLHLAALYGHYSIAKILVSSGADVSLIDSTGRSALHYACLKSRRDIVELLLANSANANLADNKGKTPEMLLGTGASPHESIHNDAIMELICKAQDRNVIPYFSRTTSPKNRALHPNINQMPPLKPLSIYTGNENGSSSKYTSPMSSNSVATISPLPYMGPSNLDLALKSHLTPGRKSSIAISPELGIIGLGTRSKQGSQKATPKKGNNCVTPRRKYTESHDGQSEGPNPSSSCTMSDGAANSEHKEIAYDMALEQIIGALDDVELKVDNLGSDNKANEDMLMDAVERLEALELDTTRLKSNIMDLAQIPQKRSDRFLNNEEEILQLRAIVAHQDTEIEQMKRSLREVSRKIEVFESGGHLDVISEATEPLSGRKLEKKENRADEHCVVDTGCSCIIC